MGIKSWITGIGRDAKGKSRALQAAVEALPGRNKGVNGLVVQSHPFITLNPTAVPFLNDTFGNAMNQNVAFSGTPEIIHNGGTSTEWDATAVQGTWNFADGAKISLTAADNNDEASFAEEGATTVDLAGFTALTLEINLTIYNEVNNDLFVAFDLAGVPVGDSVNLNDFMSPGLLGTAQNVVIPLSAMDAESGLIDGFTIILQRVGGTKPTMVFDDIQLEQTGTPAVFKVESTLGERFHIDSLRLVIADNVNGLTAVSGATQNATLLGLSYNAFLSVSALSNGIVFRSVRNTETNFSVTLRQLGDFFTGGTNLKNAISDATNTMFTLDVEFPDPIILEGAPGDTFLSFTIADNLSSLLVFTATARGSVEV